MIRGRATLISGSTGRAHAAGMVDAKASAIGALLSGRTQVLGPVGGSAARTRDTGLLHYLHVLPEQPQELVWLTPMVGIDYQIETSSGLEWQIK